MKRLSIFALGVLSCITSRDLSAARKDDLPHFAESSSSSFHVVIGEFRLIAVARHHTIVLNNNQFYRPTTDGYLKILQRWDLDDLIRVIQVEENRFQLVNLTKGTTIKAKIVD